MLDWVVTSVVNVKANIARDFMCSPFSLAFIMYNNICENPYCVCLFVCFAALN